MWRMQTVIALCFSVCMNMSKMSWRVAQLRGTQIVHLRCILTGTDWRAGRTVSLWMKAIFLRFSWQAAGSLRIEPFDGSPAVLVSLFSFKHQIALLTMRRVNKPAYSSEFFWWHIGSNTPGFPLLSMDYVNLQYIKDTGFHDLFSQAAVKKMTYFKSRWFAHS